MTNLWAGLRGLPREAWLLAAGILINRAGTMVLPFLVLYLTRSLQFSPRHAALAIMVYGIGAILTAPLAGRLADRVGPRRIVTASLFMSGALLLAYPLLRSFGSILLMTLVWSVASEGLRPASLTWMSDLVPKERRRAAFALTRLAVNLGMSLGPAVAGFVVQVSFSAIFILDAATSLLAGAVLMLATGSTLPHPVSGAPAEARETGAPPGSSDDAGAPAGPMADPLDTVPIADPVTAAATIPAAGTVPARDPVAAPPGPAYRDWRFLYFVVAILPVEIVFFQHHSMLPLFLVRDLGLRESSYGLLFTINTLLIIFIEVPLVTALSEWSYRRTLALGALLIGAGFGALALAQGFRSVALTVVVWTFGEMIFLPGSAAYAAEAAPAGRRGEYIGLYAMSFSTAFALSPWLGARVMEALGARALWVATLLAGSLSAFLLLRLREHPRSPRTAAAM
jgi:predicted MFS family arabinose efflux permease